ncbi:MAG: HEPN domain-containing protein [Nanoarchaeota archaeon]|nr:HEPN domain-containing protein [Nanoarchaeota archaeon]
MKKINFLNKLKKEGKLKIIESSEEVKDSYMEKSESNIISAKILLKHNRLEETISLSYYSMYHMLIALLSLVGIRSENHSASIILLNKLFKIDNSRILFAKKERVDKQYYTDFNIVKEDAEDLLKKAEEFNNELVDFISKLNNNLIESFRKKFSEIMSLK